MKQEIAEQLMNQVASDYDVIAQHFSHTRAFQWHEVQWLIQQYIQPGQHVLDLGCGNGRVADLLNQIKAKYVGLDVSAQLIQIARELRPNNEFYVGSMHQMPFPDATFDHILPIASFHHIPGRELRIQTLQEMKRLLKQEGYILMTNWNLHQWRFARLRWATNIAGMLGKHNREKNDLLIPWYTQDKQLLAQRYYHGFTKSEIASLARAAGLRVVAQYYETRGLHVPRRKGQNLVSVLQK